MFAKDMIFNDVVNGMSVINRVHECVYLCDKKCNIKAQYGVLTKKGYMVFCHHEIAGLLVRTDCIPIRVSQISLAC